MKSCMLKCPTSSRKLKLAGIFIGALFAMPLLSVPGAACSFVDAEASMNRSVNISSYYFWASLALCLIIAGIDILERRWSIPLILSSILLAFHPWWMVAPIYGPDCSFINIEASKLVALAIIGMLIVRAFRFLKRRRNRS